MTPGRQIVYPESALRELMKARRQAVILKLVDREVLHSQDHLRRRLDLAKTNAEAAIALYRADGGFELDDQIRRIILEMKAEERSLLAARLDRVDRGIFYIYRV